LRYFVGLDVGLHTTSICVLNAAGERVKEVSVETEPKAIIGCLKPIRRSCARVGIEACAIADWLYPALAKAGFPIICIEARHAHAILKANLNKTDRNDARSIAILMRMGVYRTVHMKSPESKALRTLLSIRRLVQIKALDFENGIGGILRTHGYKMRRVNADLYEKQVRALLKKEPVLLAVVEAMLAVRSTLRAEFDRLDAEVRAAAKTDPVCRRLMTAPGVGPIIAVTYRSVIDEPGRFVKSRTVGAHLGLTPKTYQSGGKDTRRAISRFGDRGCRSAMFSAATSILNPRTRTHPLREWAVAIMERAGRMKATVALARRLAIILHRMWVDGADYRFSTAATS